MRAPRCSVFYLIIVELIESDVSLEVQFGLRTVTGKWIRSPNAYLSGWFAAGKADAIIFRCVAFPVIQAAIYSVGPGTNS